MPDQDKDVGSAEPTMGEPSESLDAEAVSGSSLAPTPKNPPTGGGVVESTDVIRRGDARRFADQNDMLPDDPGEHRFEGPEDPERPRPSIDWASEVSPAKIGGELRRIEAEVRHILDRHDLKRKRRLAGTRRWHELEEDIIAWRFSPRIDDALLIRLRDLVARRHHVFQRLRFIASTRPTWNS